MIALDPFEQVHAQPLDLVDADAFENVAAGRIEIGVDEGCRQRTDMQGRGFDMRPDGVAIQRQRETRVELMAATGEQFEVFGRLAPAANRWHVEVHQFRIEAKTGIAGKPTPEGMHRDGVDYVLVLLINRRNIASGTTTVHDLDKRALGSFTLTDPLDAALVDDSRCYHGVTPVEPENPALPAYRDVLVVTFKKKATS